MDKKSDLPGERISLIERSKDLEITHAKHHIIVPSQSSTAELNGLYQVFDGIQNLRWNGNTEASHSIRVLSDGTMPNPSNVIVKDGRVIFMSSDGVIHCYDMQGSEIWSSDIVVVNEARGFFSFMSQDFFSSGLKVEEGVLYVSTSHAKIAAFNMQTGENIFISTLRTNARSVPLIHGELMIVQTIDNKIHAFNKNDGANVWTFTGETAELSPLTLIEPIIYDDKLIAKLSNDELIALDVHSGLELWETPLIKYGSVGSAKTNFSHMQRIGLLNSAIYTVSQDGKLNKLDAHTGTIKWSKDLMINSFFWLAGEALYAITKENELISVSIDDGALNWKSHLKSNDETNSNKITYTSPIVLNNNVMLISSDNNIYMADILDGSLKQTNFKAPVHSIPAFVDGRMIIASGDGEIIIY